METEYIGTMTDVDEQGNERILYPKTKEEAIIGLMKTLDLSEPPTPETVGRFGQHTICGTVLYVCFGSITNGNEIKYIWHKVTTKKTTPDVLVITESQTLDLTTLGLTVGDEIVVACVSGGNGGTKSGSSGNPNYGGAAGTGGSSGTGTRPGGGGGAGGGYGAGGGGGAGNGSSNIGNTGGSGGDGGSCKVETVTIPSQTIVITIGAAGAKNGGTGGTTSFGTLISVTGGGGSEGGSGGEGYSQIVGGGGGGGGGGWYVAEGAIAPSQYGAGSAGNKYTGSITYDEDGSLIDTNLVGGIGGNGGGYGNGAGAGGAAGTAGGNTTIGAGHGVVYIWY